MTARDWAAVIGASFGAFLAILDIQITNASAREIQGSLGLDLSEGGWISTAYLIAEITVIPLTAFLSKVFGMRRYMLFNCAFFVIASMLCGFAWDLKSMIFFRALQGMSGGTLISHGLSNFTFIYASPEEKFGYGYFWANGNLSSYPRTFCWWGLTDNYGWRFNFFINLIPWNYHLLDDALWPPPNQNQFFST